MSALNRIVTLFALSMALAACASVPQPLTGTYANITSMAVQQGAGAGAHVRWGGEIIKTAPGPQETCFYLLSRPLDAQARPTHSDSIESQGRFVACRTGFYDPEVFSRGRELTITGTVHGTVSEKVGEYDYAYPRVDADVVYLWPIQPIYADYPDYYDPFWGPWGGPGFGPWGWGDPFWGGGFYRGYRGYHGGYRGGYRGGGGFHGGGAHGGGGFHGGGGHGGGGRGH